MSRAGRERLSSYIIAVDMLEAAYREADAYGADDERASDMLTAYLAEASALCSALRAMGVGKAASRDLAYNCREYILTALENADAKGGGAMGV